MIVDRRTFVVKKGRMDEAVALAAEERSRIDGTYRIYRPTIGPIDVVAFEFEGGSLADNERGWVEWSATPEAAEFIKKWNELTEPGGSIEIWTLVE